MNEFFLVVLPGLEDLAVAEVKAWDPQLEVQIEKGGVTVLAPLDIGLNLNRVLKLPTRILLRVSSFMCRDFPKLFQKVSKINWSEWVEPTNKVEVIASSTRSRLKIKKRIEETCKKGWEAQQKNRSQAASSNELSVTLYVRLDDNRCTLSLDTSGERLHKRGLRKNIGEAPLRETIAAALIHYMGQIVDSNGKTIEVVDPMMGSGTILLEAAIRDQVSSIRDFGAIKGAMSKAETSMTPLHSSSRPKISSVMGFEKDKKTFQAARANLNSVSLNLPNELHNEDFFESKVIPPSDSNFARWVICNPPYGVRLKVKEPLMDFYEHIFAKSEEVLRPDAACFLLPAQGLKGKLSLPGSWKVKAKRSFSNGGISVIAFVFVRNSKV